MEDIAKYDASKQGKHNGENGPTRPHRDIGEMGLLQSANELLHELTTLKNELKREITNH